MSESDDWLGGLRQRALQMIGGGAAALAQPTAPARQWWNLRAKIDAANRVAGEEKPKFAGHHNDSGDAAGPIFTTVAGVGHELENTLPAGWAPDAHGQRGPERDMDLHNNAEGIGAAMEGRPIDRAKLQLGPIYPDRGPPDPYGAPYRQP